MTQPKVSASIITYNQLHYIGQTLDSVLNQETDFPYEVIVGDDFSNDGTRELLLEYQEKYPDKLRLILHEKNNPGITGKINFVSTLKAARGQYMTILDGDDYWTSPHKLQAQVDLLDNNPNLAASFHNSTLVFDDSDFPDKIYNSPDEPAVSKMQDLILRDWFIHSGSIMYRRKYFDPIPDFFYETPSGDLPILVMVTQHGDIGYLSEPMSVYRKNAASITNTENRNQINSFRLFSGMFETLNEQTGYKHDDTFKAGIAKQQFSILRYHFKHREGKKLREQARVCEQYLPWYSGFQKLQLRLFKLDSRAFILRSLLSVGLRIRSIFDPHYQYNKR